MKRGLERRAGLAYAECAFKPRRDDPSPVYREEPRLGFEVEGAELGPQPLGRVVVDVDLLVDEHDPTAELVLERDHDVRHGATDL